MDKYKVRIADEILKKKLLGKGAVLIEGPKWCGKTTTAEKHSKSVVYVDNPDKQYLSMADISPRRILDGDNPRLIDEWQLIPKIWDAIRYEVDHRDDMGQFILTGSAVPASYEEINHTGTGRFAWVMMRPMSLYESEESTGEVSIKELFTQPEEIYGKNKLTLDDIAFIACRGGWPRAIDLDGDIALEQAYDYYDAVVRSDISRVDGIKRDSERVKRLMRSLARNQGTQAPLEILCKDVAVNDSSTINVDTVYSYINALKKIFVVEDMAAWNPNLRSKTAIRTSDTRFFVDPSIAVAALGLGPNDLINDLNTFGFIFETMCVRDLRVFADALNGKVYHYRDKTNLECDAVLHLRDGKYGLIEIKLGGEKLIEDGARNLNKLADKIDTNKMKEPSFKMVLTATGDFAYRRKDGIYVVPLGCLKA
ncbi:MAG TPA: AAA family ATPase [Firmicutes bacterium]|nr:AAA family ATPase [Bacillota bacterium]